MGKSITARFFAEAGVPVHDADAVVHRLYEGEAVAAIETAFPGTTVTSTTGTARSIAPSLPHGFSVMPPRSSGWRRSSIRWCRRTSGVFSRRRKQRGEEVAVLDIPMLFETGGDRRVDAVVVVSAPPEVQRARVLERPGMTVEKLEAILAKQMPDAEKRRRADFVVDTSRGFEAAREQVRAILAAVATMPKRSQLVFDVMTGSMPFRTWWVAYARNRARHRNDRP